MEKFLVLLIAAPLFEDKIPAFQQAQVLSRATWSSWASKKRLAPALKKEKPPRGRRPIRTRTAETQTKSLTPLPSKFYCIYNYRHSLAPVRGPL